MSELFVPGEVMPLTRERRDERIRQRLDYLADRLLENRYAQPLVDPVAATAGYQELLAPDAPAPGPAAVVLDANLGTSVDTVAASTATLTTTAAAAAGTRIVLFAANVGGGGPNVASVSGGALTWVIDRQDNPGPTSIGTAIASADAPIGLAAGSTLTVTWAGAPGSRFLAAASFTGLIKGAAGYVDVTAVNNPVGVNDWTTGNILTTAQDLILAVCMGGIGVATNTATAPATEIHDFNSGGGGLACCTEYRFENAPSTYSVAGSWSGAATALVITGVAYKARTVGSDFRYRVPGDEVIRPLSVMCRLTTSAEVGERTLTLEYQDDENVRYLVAGVNATLAASQVNGFCWHPLAGDVMWPVDDVAIAPLPQQMIYPTHSLVLKIGNVQAGDQLDLIRLSVEKFKTGALG